MNENPSMYYVNHQGRVYGPYSAEQIVGYVNEGRLGRDVLVRQGGSEQWLPALQTQPFATALAGGAVETQLPAAPPQAYTATSSLAAAPQQSAASSPQPSLARPAVPQIGLQANLAAPTPSEERTLWEGRSHPAFYVLQGVKGGLVDHPVAGPGEQGRADHGGRPRRGQLAGA